MVGPDHAPLVSLVKHASKIKLKKKGFAEEVMIVQGGFFRVSDNKATLLLGL